MAASDTQDRFHITTLAKKMNRNNSSRLFRQGIFYLFRVYIECTGIYIH